MRYPDKLDSIIPHLQIIIPFILMTIKHSYDIVILMSATIKELRTDLKLSQAAFAKSIGISTASVVAYENGHTIPRKKVLECVSKLIMC